MENRAFLSALSAQAWPLPERLRSTCKEDLTVLSGTEGEWDLVQRRQKETEFSPLLFSRKVSGLPSHPSFPWVQACFLPAAVVQSGCGGGRNERETGSSPSLCLRHVHSRCESYFPPFDSRLAMCNHSPSVLKRPLMWCQQQSEDRHSPSVV